MKRHRTADLDPTFFGGRYTLLRRLAVGGMAEIYLARQAAMAGFEKLVVIKRLRAELADDPRIVEMFLDEARVGALLNHPNIVHVYDVDEHEGVPYIAMEYIVGEELNELCRRGIAHKNFLPLEHAVELMRQAAAGMGYFHARRGAEGGPGADRPLEIVHLDISPSNLLVTQDGSLKIIDFGIASARGQRQRTDVLPGKLGYMSPEQAARKAVDHRSDIFSLGIVLYEITVGKRLFRGSAQEVVARLVDAKLDPPTFVRRKFPAALEAIVMRTLEKHPDARYQSAYDLADDLEAFMRDVRMHSGPVRIARYLDALTHAAGGARRPELVSEAESRGDGQGELDFDGQAGGAFAPAAQAKDWEDADQPEADVAAALGMELAELRALRTPVPARPAGMAPITGKPPRDGDPARDGAIDAGDADATTPVALIDDEPDRPGTDPGDPDEASQEPSRNWTPPVDRLAGEDAGAPLRSRSPLGDSGAQAADEVDNAPTLSTPVAPVGAAALAPAMVPAVLAPTALPLPPRRTPALVPVPVPMPVPHEAPVLLAAAPPRGPAAAPPPSFGQRLPWIMVGVLVVAVAALVAYIVMGL